MALRVAISPVMVCTNMRKKCLVLGFGLGETDLDMSAAVGVLHECVGHQDLGASGTGINVVSVR